MSAFTDDRYYQREIVTDELDEACDAIAAGLGIDRADVGTKGNEKHDSGSHRSQEWIKNSPWCDNRTYTVQSGLTAEQARHIAAIDFTPGAWGTTANRRKVAEITARIIAAMKAGELDIVRECYGAAPDLKTVTGYNNVENRAASSDLSHLDHGHLGLDRKKLRDRAALMQLAAIVIGVPMTFLAPCKIGDSGPHVAFLQYALWDLHEATRQPLVLPLWPVKDNVPQIPPTMDKTTGDAMRRLLDGGDGVHFTPLLAKRLVRKLGSLDGGRDGVDGVDGEDGTDGRDGKDAVLAEGDMLVVQKRAEV